MLQPIFIVALQTYDEIKHSDWLNHDNKTFTPYVLCFLGMSLLWHHLWLFSLNLVSKWITTTLYFTTIIFFANIFAKKLNRLITCFLLHAMFGPLL